MHESVQEDKKSDGTTGSHTTFIDLNPIVYVHYLGPVIADGQDEDCEECFLGCVEVSPGRQLWLFYNIISADWLVICIKPHLEGEKLHPDQHKDENEKEKENYEIDGVRECFGQPSEKFSKGGPLARQFKNS